MRRGLFVGATLAVALACMGTARAENFDFLFRGTFSVTTTETCLQTIGGFNADLTPNAFSFVSTISSVGTAIVNGDGTGSQTNRDVSVNPPPVVGASADTVSFNLTYHVAADRTVTAQADGPITGTVLTGTLAGQTFTIPRGALATGRLSEDGRSLTQGATDAVVQTITFSGGLTLQRICTLSIVAIKVEEDVDHDVAGER
jgi:hypothetical protein